MPQTEKYFVGPQLLADIRQTITRVAGMPNKSQAPGLRGGSTDMPPRVGEPAGFRICTFTGAWGIDTAKDVLLYNSSSTAETIAATNVLIPVPELSTDTNTPTVCSIALDRNTWFLTAIQQESHAALTDVSLQPTRLQFGRKEFIAAATTMSTTGISITECDNEAASAEQLNWFFG